MSTTEHKEVAMQYATSGRPLLFKFKARYRGESQIRTHTALGPYGRAMHRSIGLS